MQNPQGVKQNKQWRVGYNQVVGAVFLTRESNPELVDQTNREGLVLGDAFIHLVAFAQKVVRFFERHHQQFERQKLPPALDSAPADDAKATSEAAAKAIADLSDLATRINILTGGQQSSADVVATGQQAEAALGRITTQLSLAVSRFESTIRQKDATLEQRQREKDTMANLASLGILAASFGHETLGWANAVAGNANLLQRDLNRGIFMVRPDVEAQIVRRLAALTTESVKIETFAGFALGNVAPGKRRRGPVSLKQVATEVFRVFERTFQQDKNVTPDLDDWSEGPCLIWAYRIDWESIFINLIVNAVWAMEKTPKDERRIRVRIEEDPELVRVTFEDSGFGFEAGTEDQLFDAGFSTKRNGVGEQEGTGMGLFIVKSFVTENSGGSIRAFPHGDLGGACFVLEAPRYYASSETRAEK